MSAAGCKPSAENESATRAGATAITTAFRDDDGNAERTMVEGVSSNVDASSSSDAKRPSKLVLRQRLSGRFSPTVENVGSIVKTILSELCARIDKSCQRLGMMESGKTAQVQAFFALCRLTSTAPSCDNQSLDVCERHFCQIRYDDDQAFNAKHGAR
jgi:hypothetical protein